MNGLDKTRKEHIVLFRQTNMKL